MITPQPIQPIPRKNTPLWIVIPVVLVLFVACQSGRGSTRGDYTPPPSRTIANADETRGVHNVCTKHMNIYAKNKFNTTNWELTYLGDVMVAPTRHGNPQGFVAKVDFRYSGGTAKFLCGVDADYGDPGFSYRSD